jgi:glyoxylase-like metal-dependent hydrolase (beta-lactamase superfamily II)
MTMATTFGAVRIDRVAELDSWPFPTAEMFPAVTTALHDCTTIDLTITTHLLRSPDGVVLVDTGNGNGKERPTLRAHHRFATDYLDRLAAVGVTPDDVDVVVLTHLHPDHCGGSTRLVDGRWVPTFPRARHLVARAEFAWLEALHHQGPTDGVPADLARTFADSVRPVVEAGLVDIVDLPQTIIDGVTLHPAAGHTAGHLVVEVTGGGRTALLTGDVLHHPLQFGDLALAQSGDADPAAAAATRRALCERAADTGARLMPAHFGGPDGGHVLRTDTGYRFEQVSE